MKTYEECNDNKTRTHFISKQYTLLFVSLPRYGSETLAFALHLIFISKPVYHLTCNKLHLPLLAYLHKSSAVFLKLHARYHSCNVS